MSGFQSIVGFGRLLEILADMARSLNSMAADIKRLREMAEEINEEEANPCGALLIPKQPLPD